MEISPWCIKLFVIVFLDKDRARNTINLLSLHIRNHKFSFRYSIPFSLLSWYVCVSWRKIKDILKNMFECEKVSILFISDWFFCVNAFLCFSVLNEKTQTPSVSVKTLWQVTGILNSHENFLTPRNWITRGIFLIL